MQRASFAVRVLIMEQVGKILQFAWMNR